MVHCSYFEITQIMHTDYVENTILIFLVQCTACSKLPLRLRCALWCLYFDHLIVSKEDERFITLYILVAYLPKKCIAVSHFVLKLQESTEEPQTTVINKLSF